MRDHLLLNDVEFSWSMAVRLPSQLNRHPEVLWHPDDGPDLPELELSDWGRPRFSEPCIAWL